MIHRIQAWGWALLVGFGLAGCGQKSDLVLVSGVVTLDGRPVENAAVLFMRTFEDKGLPASGVTDAQGRFTLETHPHGLGALPGLYQVTVTCKKVSGIVASADDLSGQVPPGGVKEEWITPRKYADPQTSGLEVNVEPGMPPVELNLLSQ